LNFNVEKTFFAKFNFKCLKLAISTLPPKAHFPHLTLLLCNTTLKIDIEKSVFSTSKTLLSEW